MINFQRDPNTNLNLWNQGIAQVPPSPKQPDPKKNVTPAKSNKNEIPKLNKTISFDNGQSLTLGTPLEFSKGLSSLDRTKEVADNNIEKFRSAYYDGMTYKFNDKEDKPNHINLGMASNLRNSLTNIILGKNDTIAGRPLAQASMTDAEDGENVIITLVDTLIGGNGGDSDGNVSSTIRITVPRDSLESATKGFTYKQKQQLGIEEGVERRYPKAKDFFETKASDATTTQASSTTEAEEGPYYNKYDKNKDNVFDITSLTSSKKGKVFEFDDTQAHGEDVAQQVNIKALDPELNTPLKLNLNFGPKDVIQSLGDASLVIASQSGDVTTLEFKQENKVGGSRVIQITLPTKSLDDAIRSLDEKTQAEITDALKDKKTSNVFQWKRNPEIASFKLENIPQIPSRPTALKPSDNFIDPKLFNYNTP